MSRRPALVFTLILTSCGAEEAMKNRTEARSEIAGNRFDLCVIGAGATGAACALDAQLRGIRTVLLDAGDFGGATSSAATKIVHGGVRYLEEAVTRLDIHQYRVLARALQERVRMLANAPHLTRRLEFLVPCYSWIGAAYLDIGLKIYDRLAGRARLSPSRFFSQRETLRRMPGLAQKGLIGSVAYADGQFDDARYNLALVESFARAGGSALNYARVEGLLRDGRDRISGVAVKDALCGEVFRVEAKTTVNATGPWSDSIRQMASTSAKKRMRPSKGAHILLPVEIFPSGDAMLIPKTEDGRILFVIPWGGRLLVGTTDEETSADTEMVVTQRDVEYLLRHVNRYLARPATPEDIVSGFAGARPLVASDGEGSTSTIARDDVIEVDPKSGLISIMGGKWTTHRAMAEDTIDRVQKLCGLPRTASATREYILAGGEGFTEQYWQPLVREYGITEETARHLVSKFGTASEQVLSLRSERPGPGEPIIAGHPALQAEVVYAARCEMAVTIEDVLARRIGIQLYSWRAAIEAAPLVGSLLAAELGWTDTAARDEVERYVSRVHYLLTSAGLANDRAAEESY